MANESRQSRKCEIPNPLSQPLCSWQPHPEERKEAARWLLRGAGVGHPEALYNLRICYAVGVGVRKDVIQAYKYMYAAKARGYDANEALSQLEKEMTPEKIAE